MTIDVARIAFAQREYRVAKQEDLSVQLRHPLATETEFPSILRNLSDANTLGAGILALRKLDRWTWACFVQKNIYSIEIGSTITLRYPRYDFDAGVNFIVKRLRRDSNALFDELTLFGPEDTSDVVLPVPPGNFLLKEDGGYLLLESGGRLVLE